MEKRNDGSMQIDGGKVRCPCCGFYTLDGFYGSFDICPVCFWENDPLQFENPLLWGGANPMSLLQARVNYRTFGAADRGCLKHVRGPEDTERSGTEYVSPRCLYDPAHDLLYIKRFEVTRKGNRISRIETLDWRSGSCLSERAETGSPVRRIRQTPAGCVRLDFREAMRKLSTYELKHAVFTKLSCEDLAFINAALGSTPEQLQRLTDGEAHDLWIRLNEMADAGGVPGKFAAAIREKLSGWAIPCWDIPDWMTKW